MVSVYRVINSGRRLLSCGPGARAGGVGSKVIDVSGWLEGATLIRREVLEAVEFHGYMGTGVRWVFRARRAKEGLHPTL